MDYATGYIIMTELLDHRETRGSAPSLELYGFLRCLYMIVASGVDVRFVVTDENTQIKKFFSK
jgi:hypothetical protein